MHPANIVVVKFRRVDLDSEWIETKDPRIYDGKRIEMSAPFNESYGAKRLKLTIYYAPGLADRESINYKGVYQRCRDLAFTIYDYRTRTFYTVSNDMVDDLLGEPCEEQGLVKGMDELDTSIPPDEGSTWSLATLNVSARKGCYARAWEWLCGCCK